MELRQFQGFIDPDPDIFLNTDTDLGYFGKNVKNEQLKKKMIKSLNKGRPSPKKASRNCFRTLSI